MDNAFTALLARAIAIAASAHESQRDRAGAPYILHPLRMMMRGKTPQEQIVAVLHDVVEDSDWSLDQLAVEGFPPNILNAIDCLTRRPDESYAAFIDRALTNPLAAQVKLYDLEDNMTLTRLNALHDQDWSRLQRYHTAHQQVCARLTQLQLPG